MNQESRNGYDRIAPVYDILAKMFFFGRIRRAQIHFLKELARPSTILVLGGGTGWLLPLLRQNYPESEIWYVDSSFEMLKRAQRRLTTNTHFIHGTLDDLPSISFDAILTGFFFDQFPEVRLSGIVKRLKIVSKSSSVWLIADFTNGRIWWQAILLRAMYLFFGMVCGIEAKSLPHWNQILLDSGLERIGSACFYNGFIQSVRYRMASAATAP